MSKITKHDLMEIFNVTGRLEWFFQDANYAGKVFNVVIYQQTLGQLAALAPDIRNAARELLWRMELPEVKAGLRPRSRNYTEHLDEQLKDKAAARAYLLVALEDPDPNTFATALDDIIRANLPNGTAPRTPGSDSEQQ